MGWQSRFRWILTPGSDFYVVYNHNWLDDPVRSRFVTLDRRAASKVFIRTVSEETHSGIPDPGSLIPDPY